MTQRQYTLQDIYDYLKEFYNMDWELGKILADEEKEGVLSFKFGGKYGTNLTVLADIYINKKKETIWLEVTNENFKIFKTNPRHKELEYKPPIFWQDFYTTRHNTCKTL